MNRNDHISINARQRQNMSDAEYDKVIELLDTYDYDNLTDALQDAREELRESQSRVYTYTAKDSEQIVGTLPQIGEELVSQIGDTATQDNQEPWLDLDESGEETYREFTLDQWVAWASRAEDRPERHVERALVEGVKIRLTTEQLRAAREGLRLSWEELAAQLDVRGDTLRKWARGVEPQPYGLREDLIAVCDSQIAEAQRVRNALTAETIEG